MKTKINNTVLKDSPLKYQLYPLLSGLPKHICTLEFMLENITQESWLTSYDQIPFVRGNMYRGLP